MRLVHHATQLIYSGASDFAEIVSHLERFGPRANPEEIHIAIKSVFEIEGAFEDAVYSAADVSDKTAIRSVIDAGLAKLEEAHNETDTEVRRLSKVVIRAEAEHAFSSIKIAFAFADLASEESFGGLVRKGNKINRGPISIAQRKRFKMLAEQLEASQATIRDLEKEEKRLLEEQARLQAQLDEFNNDEVDEEYGDDDDPRAAYPHAFNFHYSVDDDDELTTSDRHLIENAVNRWCDATNYYCEIEPNDNGFRIFVWCFSNSRESVGTNLFLHLADNVFRSIGKSIRYI